MSLKSSPGPDWPRDAQELFTAFWEAATFHAGALQAARDYAEKFNEQAKADTGPLSTVANDFAADAEVFKLMAEDLIETFASLSKQVRITVEKARLNELDNPAEVRRLKDRIRDLHRDLYIECLESLGHGLDQAKKVAAQLRSNPEQTDQPEHLAQLNDVIDEAEDILDRDEAPEEQFGQEENEEDDYSLDA